MRHIIPISGKDSLATALVQSARDPTRDYEYFFNDVGMELPETYEWLRRVEDETGWQIHRVGKSLRDKIDEEGILPSHRTRFCTRLCKIEPMEEWIGEDEAVIYYGLRADEDRPGYRASSEQITPTYPLQDLGIDLKGVYSVIRAQSSDDDSLMPPSFFWPSLHDQVTSKIGPPDSWAGPPLQLHERRALFAGRSRSNCFSCFYQRQYEYVWLYDTHPDLFEEACEIEERTGAEDYTWREAYRLADLPDRREEILDRRASAVAEKIASRSQATLFDVQTTRLAETSCGLHCGK
jgi:hypothetical protein